MQKIRIYGEKSVRYAVTDLLQEKGNLQINTIPTEINPVIQDYFAKEHGEIELQLANIEFAINFLSKFADKKDKIKKIKISKDEYKKTVKAYYFKDVVEKCLNIEEETVKNSNHLAHLEDEKNTLIPWEKLNIALKDNLETEYATTIIGWVSQSEYEEMKKNIDKATKKSVVVSVNQENLKTYFYIVADKNDAKKVELVLQKHKYVQADFLKRRGNPAEELDRIQRNMVKTEQAIIQLKNEAQALGKEIKNLCIVYDYFNNIKDWKESRKKFLHTEDIFVIEGWMPKGHIKNFKKQLERISKATYIQELAPAEKEVIPVEIKNNALIAPFEAVTRIYGLPLSHEVDPTPFLAIFFIIFFGLCLTDAGYGLLLFALTAGASIFLDIPKETKKLVHLLMFGGISTFVLGMIFGGYFGLEAVQLPSWLTYTKQINGVETTLFIGQLINPVREPLTVLGLSFLLGYLQMIFGKLVDGWWKMKKGNVADGLLDGWLWAYALLSLGAYAAVNFVPALQPYATVGAYGFYVAIILLILTQGRKQKNIIGKLGSGILSLYGFIGYISDILSYSRLLALGLATGIIAMSINLIANIIGNMIPVIGPVVMVIILIGGHIFNLALNALGAFIHSGRLQFVEFFGKFMEGGGTQFKPFKKKYEFVSLEEEK